MEPSTEKSSEEFSQKKKPKRKFSLSAHLEDKPSEATEETTVSKDLPRDPFSKEQLDAIWQRFLTKIRQTDPILFYPLSKFEFDISSDKVCIQVPHEKAKEEFLPFSNVFFRQAEKELNNYHVDWQFNIKPIEKKEVLTERQKFEKLAEEYPSLKLLDQEFKLEFDN